MAARKKNRSIRPTTSESPRSATRSVKRVGKGVWLETTDAGKREVRVSAATMKAIDETMKTYARAIARLAKR